MFRDFLNEKKTTIFHGDNYNTLSLTTALMNNGNNQEGIGIYFSDRLSTAESYGKDISSLEIDSSKLLESRSHLSAINKSKLIKFLTSISKDEDAMYNLMTDYGVEIYDTNIKAIHIKEIYDLLIYEQVRNFQIDIAGRFSTDVLVNAWNKYIKIDGLYNKQHNGELWYSIINTSLKLTKII